jgi:RND family efflux transporter MFP subunit
MVMGFIMMVSGLASGGLLEANCLVEASRVVNVGSPVTGLLDEVLVRRADRVLKGQVVARLESRVERAAVALAVFRAKQLGPTELAQSRVEFARKKFDRRQALAREKMMSAAQGDEARADLKAAQAELKVAVENRESARLEQVQQSGLLDLRTIRSPFDGVVVEQAAYPGEVVGPDVGKGTILKLARLDPLQIRVVLPKREFGRVTSSMSAEIWPEIPVNARYAAKVRSVDPLVDAASGTFVVLLELPNPELKIPSGVACKVRFNGVQAQK